jgi:glycosyltransferase involved in cell wall biosynthesis
MAVHFAVSQADEWVGKGLIPSDGRVFRSIRRLEADVFAQLDGVVFVSESVRRELWIGDLGRIPTATIPNFIAAPEIPRHPDLRADLISLGGLEPRKNHRFLVEVLSAARRRGYRYTLAIAGEGPERHRLLEQARLAGVDGQLQLLGHVPGARQLLPHYRAYAHSANSEAFGMALVEAMAVGIPILAPAVGGIPSIFDDPSEGRYWSLDDAEAAAGVLIDMLEDEPERARMGLAAHRRYLDCFDVRTVGPLLHRFLTAPAA